MAHIKKRPDEFIKKNLQGSVMLSVGISVFVFFMFDMLEIPIILVLPLFLVIIFLVFMLLMQAPKAKIKKRERDLEREVLFAGRFLLVKVNSGRPLLNSLVDASKSYGVSAKYFKEIVDDVTMGTSIEKALDNAMKYTPSDKFRRIIFQISNAIKIGSDVSDPLASALEDISKQQMIEIQRYGKKLSSLSLFYMLLAIIMPSLGMAMMVVIGSLLGIFEEGLALLIFAGVIVFLIVIQTIFIMIFKSNRLSVNL